MTSKNTKTAVPFFKEKIKKEDKIKIKNSRNLFKDVNQGVEKISIAYNERLKNPGKFIKVFKNRFNKLSDNIILGKKYQTFNRKVKEIRWKRFFKLFIYILLSITIIAVTNITLLQNFKLAIDEYFDQNPDIKDKKIIEIIKGILNSFIEKMNQLSLIQRLLVGTIFLNTIVNQIPVAYDKADYSISKPFFEMLQNIFQNLFKLENSRIISTS